MARIVTIRSRRGWGEERQVDLDKPLTDAQERTLAEAADEERAGAPEMRGAVTGYGPWYTVGALEARGLVELRHVFAPEERARMREEASRKLAEAAVAAVQEGQERAARDLADNAGLSRSTAKEHFLTDAGWAKGRAALAVRNAERAAGRAT